jgi:hypothetical protein
MRVRKNAEPKPDAIIQWKKSVASVALVSMLNGGRYRKSGRRSTATSTP